MSILCTPPLNQTRAGHTDVTLRSSQSGGGEGGGRQLNNLQRSRFFKQVKSIIVTANIYIAIAVCSFFTSLYVKWELKQDLLHRISDD